MVVHGPWCNTKTFPLDCYGCGARVFYFSCDHQSRVFFDELGHPWPKHNCQDGGEADDFDLSEILSLEGVSFSPAHPSSDGLLTGFVRGSDSIDLALVSRVRESQNQAREIMRIEPLGSTPEVIIGKVQERLEPDLSKKYSVDRNSIGYGELAKKIGDADPLQFTVLVDELASDPDAIDYLSYTFLCAKDLVNRNIRKGALVEVNLEQAQPLGIGPFWLARAIERIA